MVKRHDFENVQHVVDIVAHELAAGQRVVFQGFAEKKITTPSTLTNNKDQLIYLDPPINDKAEGLKIQRATPLSHPKQCPVQPKNVGTYQFA